MDSKVFYTSLFILSFSFFRESSSLNEIKQILDVMPDNPIGTIVFLHCSGDTGPSFKNWLDFVGGTVELFSNMHLIFPTAPTKLYSPLGPQKEATIWYDETITTPKGTEKLPVMEPIAADLVEIIRNETKNGIPFENIYVGGFGMGGTMALHVAYRHLPQVAGCFVLSSYLKHYSYVYRIIKERRKKNKAAQNPEMFFAQGDQDWVVQPKWSAKTFIRLRRIGITGSYFSIPNAYHEVVQKELIELDKWILTKMGRL